MIWLVGKFPALQKYELENDNEFESFTCSLRFSSGPSLENENDNVSLSVY